VLDEAFDPTRGLSGCGGFRRKLIYPFWNFLGIFNMDTVGVALIVGGMAFLFSGLIFLIPTGASRAAPQDSLEDNQEQIEQYLREMSRERGDIDA
jgi:hypothetical protein